MAATREGSAEAAVQWMRGLETYFPGLAECDTLIDTHTTAPWPWSPAGAAQPRALSAGSRE